MFNEDKIISDIKDIRKELERFRIFDVPGTKLPPQAARYTSSTAQSIPDSKETILNFDISYYDTNTLVTTGAAWKFTAKVAGYYQINLSLLLASHTWSAGQFARLLMYVNTSGYSYFFRKTVEANITFFMDLQGSDTVYLAADTYLQFKLIHVGGAGVTLYADSAYNHISIVKVA